MKNGFVKVATITPKCKVADTTYNGEQIRSWMKEAAKAGAMVTVFPELCITGYSCADLFLQRLLLKEARIELQSIAEASGDLPGIFFVGLPYEIGGKLYNMAAAISQGEILGMVPKTYIPNYNEFYEARQFTSGRNLCTQVYLGEQEIPVSTDLLFSCQEIEELKIGAEICEDLWTPNPPSISHAMAGATVMVNLSASDEITGKNAYRRELVAGQSARLLCGYLYCSAGDGESTQDVVYSGHNLICENGHLLKESESFSVGMVLSELDVERIMSERRRMSTFETFEDHTEIYFSLGEAVDTETTLTRFVDPAPFVPGKKEDRDLRCNEILQIQAMGLKKRLEHTGCNCAVVGISGGLDSTLALLVTARAFDLLGKDRSGITAVTMPGFGTTDRTYDNAVNMIRCIGAEFVEVDIKNAVRVHFSDIGQDESVHDVT